MIVRRAWSVAVLPVIGVPVVRTVIRLPHTCRISGERFYVAA
jgi:hypothetical protein